MMKNSKKNIFNDLPNILTGEDFSEILSCQNVVIERIVSSDRPDTKAYNQIQDEWVILLQGKATLEFEEQNITLNSGDYLFIPANTNHRVISTSNQPICIWLAIHIYPHNNE